MADFGAPIAQDVNVNPQQGLQTIAELVGIQQQRQKLQTQTAEAQQQQQTARQRQAIASWFQNEDPMEHTGADGTLDLNGLLSGPSGRTLAQAAGDQYPQVVQALITAKQTQIGAKQSLAALNGTLRGQFNSVIGSLTNSPDVAKDDPAARNQVLGAIAAWGKTGGPDAQRIAQVYGGMIAKIPQGKLQTGLRMIQLQAEDASAQAATQQPGYTSVSTGGQTNLYQTNPYGPSSQQPPGSLPAPLQSGTLPSGQTVLVNPATRSASVIAAGGNAAAASAGPPNSSNDPARPGSNAPTYLQEAYGKSVTQAQGAVYAAQQADANYGTDMETANMIRQFSNQASTGPGTSAWVRFTGAVGSRIGSQNVASYQTLASFLDLQSSRLRDSMNLPATNAGMATSQEMGTSIESQRNAIQAKTDYYQALTQLNHQYRLGMDAAGANGVNPSPTAVKSFQRRFASAADPINTEIELATQRGDEAAVARIVAGLSPQQRQELIAKRKAYSTLIAGEVPNG